MSRGSWNFRKTDVRRAVEAAEQAGAHVARIEIDPGTGKISLVTGAPAATGSEALTEFDKWKADRARSA
jgi:hypothetical protein